MKMIDADRRRLGTLLTNPDDRAWGTLKRRADLYSLLEEATPIDSRDAPETLVTMNTTVELVDLRSGSRRIVTLAYPDDLDAVSGGVSVLKPLGVALIGREEGDVVQCPDEHGNRPMLVANIVHQPERSGLWHL